MARSFRRTPIFGNTTAQSESTDKRIANRRWRSAVRCALTAGDDDIPHRREKTNPWDMAKDGKRWMGRVARKRPAMMRK